MFFKNLHISLLIFTCFFRVSGQETVSQTEMKAIYEQVKTPYKYGLVMAPSDNYHKMDCPTIFRKGEKWYMTFVVYNGKNGTDGRGYETWMAQSDDLLKWTIKGRLLSFKENTWDKNQHGGFPSLPDMNWGGSYELQPYKGKYWMTYIGGENAGYEAGPLKVGLSFTKAKNLEKAQEWNAFQKPILTPEDKDHQWFENITQYKSTVYWDKEKKFGKQFVMVYNAGGINPENKVKAERIGIALSDDMKHWERYAGNPVFTHEEGITGDAHIQKFEDTYVMFYFSAFRADRNYKAFNTFACSKDLIHWYDWKGEDLIIPSKNYDNLFAHKSYVINFKGVVYHFYCAVNKFDQRGIAVATSKPMGRSEVQFPTPEIKEKRINIPLNDNWLTWMKNDTLHVNVPHNWDDYFGYRQLTHGNLHGTATYSKSFTAPEAGANKEYFLRFEGIGTYATVILNGKKLGRFLSGRTTFSINVTKNINIGKENKLTVVAEHPEMISDMPWVCGGCSSEWGFSEGSQPLGIFRPVTLEITDNVRIEPYGVHVWHNQNADTVFIETEIKNYSSETAEIEVVNKLNDDNEIGVFRLTEKVSLKAGEIKIIRQSSPVKNPKLWSIEKPYLYKLVSMIKRGDNVTTDEISTPFGIRTISWQVKRNDNDGRFYLNSKPLFINGVCEYENILGKSHAFSDEQIHSRIKQIKSAGFNAFREAHQPHNLLYQKLLDENGTLFWSQFSAHIWYDTPEFRENFKQLLRQWIKERRNSPSIIMWGLQNESVLPRDFAEECSNIIREMDPTAKNMRVITTCNGGVGTDWNVVQNWSGTYSGNIEKYDQELAQKNQLLNGEYGAWRSIDFHSEPAEFNANGSWTENRMCQLLEKKIKLAENVKDSVCGQFLWVFNSHDNPGRKQPDEAYRVIDKVGPVNYKGLLTPWEEPTDAYYMYRANYVSPKTDPMVYLVSHTWNNRFDKRKHATIEVFSNCDSVKLYNDATDDVYLGKKKNNGIGTHFMWENRDIQYNVLRAVGYFDGKPVAEDVIILNNLDKAPHFDNLFNENATSSLNLIKGDKNYNYICRINCGGDAYTDEFGQLWAKDDTTVSRSWASGFKDLNPYLGSQRTTHDPIKGTRDWDLMGHFRYGNEKLSYNFSVPEGKYRIELYFIEPWYGTGASYKTDCEGLRIFDVAVNDIVRLKNLDIWAEVGHDKVLKKVIYADAKDGKLKISFPNVKAGQAVISAIAIASEDKNINPIKRNETSWSWAEADKNVVEKTPKELLPADKNARIGTIYEAEKASVKGKTAKIIIRDKEGVSFERTGTIQWDFSTGLAQIYALRFNYVNPTGKPVTAKLQLIDASGAVLKNTEITFPENPEKWKQISTTTGNYINAGKYKIILAVENANGFGLESMEVQ